MGKIGKKEEGKKEPYYAEKSTAGNPTEVVL